MKIGGDPEFFAMDSSSGQIIPAETLGLGGKDEYKLPLLYGDEQVGEIHRDNAMVELCLPVIDSPTKFVETVELARAGAALWLRDNAGLIMSSLVDWIPGDQYGEEWRERFPLMQEIGCSPDCVALMEDGTPVTKKRRAFSPADFKKTAGVDFRGAGGHIHLSYEESYLVPEEIVMLCDRLLGKAFGHPFMSEELRDRMYGMPGLYRPTKYPDGSVGVEYRALSNQWLHHTGHAQNVAFGLLVLEKLLQSENEEHARRLLTEIKIEQDIPIRRQGVSDSDRIVLNEVIVAVCPEGAKEIYCGSEDMGPGWAYPSYRRGKKRKALRVEEQHTPAAERAQGHTLGGVTTEDLLTPPNYATITESLARWNAEQERLSRLRETAARVERESARWTTTASIPT